MSRYDKLKKLGNAIREYRGSYHARSGKWIQPPRPEAVARVLRWLAELKIEEPIVALAEIQQFKTFDEMRAWLRNISESWKEAA